MARHATNPGKLKLTNTNIYLNAKRCSGRNTRTPVHQETTRKLNSQTSRAEEVCLKNASMNDVHMTSPQDNHDHDHDHDRLHDTTTKGWRFGGSTPWMSHHPSGSRQGHPRYTGAVTTEGRGWPDQRPTGRSHAQRRSTER